MRLLIVVCAWCGRVYKYKQDEGDRDELSHGICENCRAEKRYLRPAVSKTSPR
jgi:hypothetical protein